MSYDIKGGIHKLSEAYIVKADPFSGLRYVGAFAIIGGIGTTAWVSFRWGDISRIIPCLVLTLIGTAIFWSLSPWSKVEKLRQSAAHQENTAVLLAVEQPVPDEAALTLPCTIKLRPKWTIPLIAFVLLIPVSATPLQLAVWLHPPQPALAGPGVISFSVFVSALLASILPLLGWRTIKVTENGLNVQECSILSIGCNLRTIKWSEAQLFAIYPSRKHSDHPMYYELSGKYAIVRWRRMRPGDSFRLSKRPTPFDEYDRQMEALLSLIAAKTSLPLYDLRG